MSARYWIVHATTGAPVKFTQRGRMRRHVVTLKARGEFRFIEFFGGESC
jgi:hypothetical protein